MLLLLLLRLARVYSSTTPWTCESTFMDERGRAGSSGRTH